MKQNKKFWLLIVLLMSFFGIAFSKPQTVSAKTYTNSQLRSYVKRTLKKHHLRGTVVIVRNGHRQQISEGYGYYKRRINNGSKKLVYPTGSLQKSITAAIITQLIYKKKFTQNTKISRWYPHLKNASKITVGQLDSIKI